MSLAKPLAGVFKIHASHFGRTKEHNKEDWALKACPSADGMTRKSPAHSVVKSPLTKPRICGSKCIHRHKGTF